MGGDGAGRHGLEVILPRGEHPTYQGASLDIIGLVATNGINLPNCDAVKVGRECQVQILEQQHFFHN